MKGRLRIYETPAPLTRKYTLSFRELDSFETYIVRLDADGMAGLGEVTLLPGYNREDRATLMEDLDFLARELSRGAPLASLIPRLSARSPFFASGLACALETRAAGCRDIYATPVAEPVPLCAAVYGQTPESSSESAAGLLAAGFRVLKAKVGLLPVEQELARVLAIARALPDGASLRLDANQAYSLADARALCRGLEGVPGIELLEQPFGPAMWREHETLCRETTVPIMLDESVWGEDDIRRSADCGARLVKLKLAKHPGMDATSRLAGLAGSLGLGIVLGNGVQTEIGNHLEIRLHAEIGLTSCSESNGFLKIATPLFKHSMTMREGMVHAGGVDADFSLLDAGLPLATIDAVTIAE